MADETKDAGLYAVPAEGEQAAAVEVAEPEQDWTGTRRVLRYKPQFDTDGLATVLVGDDPVIRYAGQGTSPTVCLWVEVDGGTADATEIRVASLPTGAAVPQGGEYLGMVREATPFGFAIRHLYRLP